MRTASVRDVQHHLSQVLRWVDEGEEVEITRRDQVVARLVPVAKATAPVDWDEHARWLRDVFPAPLRGEPALDTVRSGREDRV